MISVVYLGLLGELAPLGGGGLAFLLELYISPFSWQVLLCSLFSLLMCYNLFDR